MPRKKSGAKPGRETAKPSPASRPRPNSKVPTAERRSFEGWVRLPGKAKQHKNVETGEVLSDRKYRERFLYGGSKLESVAAKRGTPRTQYTRLLKARQDYLAQHGVKANLQEIRQSDAMKQIVRDLKKHKAALKRAHANKHLSAAERRALFGPDSDLARALADLGYRDHDARHFVGDS